MNLEWIKTVPDYINYFNQDHQLIIDLIGINNYIRLYSYFSKTGIYFSGSAANNDQQKVIELIGEDNYLKLFNHFGRAGIYFSTASINSLKKAWAQLNHSVDYNEAARNLGVATKTIYRWRQECSKANK